MGIVEADECRNSLEVAVWAVEGSQEALGFRVWGRVGVDIMLFVVKE